MCVIHVSVVYTRLRANNGPEKNPQNENEIKL